MIIGVDAGCLGVSDERLKAGVYHYAYNLLKKLISMDKKNRYLLYSFIPIKKEIMDSFGSNAENRVLQPKKGWLNLRLSWEFILNKTDLFLGLGQALPIFHPKSLVFVYDLAFERFPSCYQDRSKLSRQTRYAANQSDRIAAISNSTKRDLTRFYGVDGSKIDVVYPGVDPLFSTKTIKKHQLTGSYFLSVGSLKPIKNIPRIIEAFALFLKKTKKNYKLVLAGSDFWLDKEIMVVVKRLKLEKQISILGFVKRDNLPGLYSGAKALVIPSLYEGFGLPILEAMVCGCPVITGNTGSMPEAAGKTALLVDPLNIREISQALYKIDNDGNLAARLRKKGLERIKKFTWEKAAVKTLKIIDDVERY